MIPFWDEFAASCSIAMGMEKNDEPFKGFDVTVFPLRWNPLKNYNRSFSPHEAFDGKATPLSPSEEAQG
jgi:hypothetical protein